MREFISRGKRKEILNSTFDQLSVQLHLLCLHCHPQLKVCDYLRVLRACESNRLHQYKIDRIKSVFNFLLSMRLNMSGWELEIIFCLVVFTPIFLSVCSIAPQQVRLGGSCQGFYEAHLIERFSWHFFLICLEVSNSRHLRCVNTQLFLSVARVCSSTKFLMPRISNKSFPGVCLTVLKDVEVIFEILLNDSFAKNFLMQLQVQFNVK